MSGLLAIAIPVIDVVLIMLGIALLAGWNPFERVPGIGVPMVANPFARAYVYGLFVGPLALPCVGVFLVALLAISVGLDEAIPRVMLFLVYGLGFGFPLVVLSLVAARRGQALTRVIVGHHRVIEGVAGAVLILVGFGDLVLNWDAIRAAFDA